MGRAKMTMRRSGIDCFRALLPVLLAAGVLGSMTLAGTKPAEAAFEGSNGKIAFASKRSIVPTDTSSTDFEIFTMSPDGTGLQQLTVNDSRDLDPAWSPDGTKIAFTSDREVDFEVYKMNADGSSQVNLTNNEEDYDAQPAWSPSGKKIAFTTNRDNGSAHIYKMNADGSSQRRLTKTPHVGDSRPAWSPDGTRITFESYRDGTVWSEIYKTKPKPDGRRNRPINLSKSPQIDDGGADWSPNGKQIVFWRDSEGWGPDIYKMNADGTGATQLTDISSSGNAALHPTWSPDGTKIAFTSARHEDGSGEIYTMNADGSNQTNLTNDSVGDANPDWQPTSS